MTATLPSQPPLPNSAPLLELLDRQIEICLDLECRSSDLLERLGRGERDEVTSLLVERKPLIDELSSLNRQFATRCPSWSAFLSTLSVANRNRATEAVERLDELLRRVRAVDTLLGERLGEVRAEISRALSGLQNARNSNRAYVTGSTSPCAPGKNKFMDERG